MLILLLTSESPEGVYKNNLGGSIPPRPAKLIVYS